MGFLRLVALGVSGLALYACTGDGTATTTTTSIEPPTITEPPREHDGVLTVGVLLPLTGDGATIGQPLADAVGRAVDEINESGGVLGEDIELVSADEGSTVASAAEAVATLLAAGVDAVVGPASSNIALATLDQLTGTGVVTCSPTATALALDEFPDDDLFFRTVPSDSLLTEAIALEAERTGARSAGVAFLDDAYGRPLATATLDALGARGIIDVIQVPFASNDDTLVDDAGELADRSPDVIIVLGDADNGMRMLDAIGREAELLGASSPPDVIVNDAMRRPPPAQVQALAPLLLESLRGVGPKALPVDDSEPNGPFATNAYDCLNLFALGAVQSESDDPAAIAGELFAVANQGSPCRDFSTCALALANGRNIDYNGPSGLLALAVTGDASRGNFDVFEFGADGADISVRSFVVPS